MADRAMSDGVDGDPSFRPAWRNSAMHENLPPG
jgi:hypothetical protein